MSSAFSSWMKAEHPNILVLYIPPGTTSKLQPQDVVVQRPMKAGILTAFKTHQVQQFARAETLAGTPGADAAMASLTDFRMSVIKPLTPLWIYAGWLSVAKRPEMVRAGWAKCGLLDAWTEACQMRAMAAMTNSDHEFFPLFPAASAAAQLDKEAAAEPMQEPICLRRPLADIDMNEEEAEFVAGVMQEATAGPLSTADQLLVPELVDVVAVEAESLKRSTFLAAFKRAPAPPAAKRHRSS
jgi:hypothetical protein